MDYNSRKIELLDQQKIVLQKHKELLTEVCNLVVGMQNLAEASNNSIDETVDWIRYMAQDDDVDKSFRLAAALQYVENPNDEAVVESLKENIELNRLEAQKTKRKKFSRKGNI